MSFSSNYGLKKYQPNHSELGVLKHNFLSASGTSLPDAVFLFRNLPLTIVTNEFNFSKDADE